MISYNNIVERFSKFVENHHFLREFSHGSPEDLDQTKEPEYPLLHLILSNVSYGDRTTDSLGSSKTYTLQCFILDLPPDKIDKASYQKEVISDCQKIAEDILADVINGFNVFVTSGQYFVTGATFEPLEEETKNVLAGGLLTFDLTVPYDRNACDLPLTGVDEPGLVACEDATYQNSDGTFTTTIASGATFTSTDITITDVDGSTRTTPSNKNVTCTWATLTVRNTAGTSLGTVASYPSGGNVVVANQNIDLNNSDGTTIQNVPSHVVGADISVGDTLVVDSGGSNFTDATALRILLPNTTVSSISTAAGVMTITTPTVATGIIYRRPHFSGQTTSYATGDVAWQSANGTYDWGDSGNVVQDLDHSSLNPFYTLLYNNVFGNKYRFTDSVGAQADDNLANFDAANFTTNRPTAIPYYVIDHLTGLGWIFIKVGVNDNWTTSIATANAYSDGTNSDYRMPSVAELESVINLQSQYFGSTNIFEQSDIIATGSDLNIWLSNTDSFSSGNAYRYNNSNEIRRIAKTSTSTYGTYVCRTQY